MKSGYPTPPKGTESPASKAAPFVGLAVKKIDDQLGNHPVYLTPNSLEIEVEKKILSKISTAIITINFNLNEVEIIDEDKRKELEEDDTKDKRSFLGFKENSYSNGEYEIDTKKMPKLVLTPPNGSIDKLFPLALTPTIESNDTTVRVNSNFLLDGYIDADIDLFPAGLKVPITQKILGDYIIGGLNADSFKVTVRKNGDVDNSIAVTIHFELQGAEINDGEILNLAWKELLKHKYMAYVIFNSGSRLTDSGNPIYCIKPDPKSDYPLKVKVNFSFSIIDGIVTNSGKVPPNSGKVPPNSGILPLSAFNSFR